MTGEREGSKAMSVYIVICFALAMGAAVGYKLMNDKREELLGAYPRTRMLAQELDKGLMPNVTRYYELVRAGEIQPPSPDDMLEIPAIMATIACGKDPGCLGLLDTAGPQDQVDMPTSPQNEDRREYMEYNFEVVLKGVSHSQWEQFLKMIKYNDVLRRYTTVSKLTLLRMDDSYAKITLGDGNIDGSRWKVTIMLTWFGKAKDKPGTAKTT